MTIKNVLQQAAANGPAGAGYLDIVGVVLTLVPVVHRITSMLKSVEPVLHDWLEAETDLAAAEAAAVREGSETMSSMAAELRHNQETLIEAVRRINEHLDLHPPSNHDEGRDDQGPGGQAGADTERTTGG